MKILLEELPHQEKAIEAIDETFTGVDERTNDPDKNYVYANPIINKAYQDSANIDVKMETGTGKTYVGVRSMYELHRKYGIFKFVIVVPSPAIKEGWKNFISADYAKQHFSQFYENTQINLNVINAGDFKAKSGRNNMPAQLTDFVEGSSLNSNTIEVLLINAGMLSSKSMKKDYDQTLLSGWTNPIDAIKATRPIVIIDEPHRFPRNKANYKSIEAVEPQAIIRFGATFPFEKGTKGPKDYYRKQPQFNLNAVQSFNQGLVKGIDIYYPNISDSLAQDKYVVDSVTNKELVLKHGTIKRSFGIGDDIGFDGDITYVGGKKLSNDLELEKNMAFFPATMATSYQEMIIRDAIDKHFDAEIDNFMRENNNQAKVKTLSLFFIDSINSYRNDDNEDGWLKVIFERLLREKVESLIKEFQFKLLPREKEYLSFLQATLANLTDNVSAAYFGKDRNSSDEAIQAEVDDILKNKEKLLSFKDSNGNWETRRFLFSKWTLREGWDNPNVFVIAKLRTSGSENSKIQEVGRGLRLPVDENGHRLKQDELSSRLSFLIGYDEKDFADKLVGEVNADADIHLNETKLTDEMIKLIVDSDKELNEDDLLERLDNEGVIKRNNDFKDGGLEKLLEIYPVLSDSNRVKSDRITKFGSDQKKRIKLKKENWNKMRDLWKNFSNRYMLEFDSISEEAMNLLLDDVFNKSENFVFQYQEFTKDSINVNDGESYVNEQKGEYNSHNKILGMKYGEFLRKLAKNTKLKVNQLHKHLYVVLKEKYDSDNYYLNELTLRNLSTDFKNRFEERYKQSYQYHPLDFQASTSVYDIQKDDFKDDVSAEVIGVNIDEKFTDDSNRELYETPPLRFDSSNPEKELLEYQYDAQVTVFGKLPKRAIQVPKYTGGSTTPDFIYMINRKDDKSLYLLVETKAENMREGDRKIIEIQRKFFENLKEHGIDYTMATKAADVYEKISNLKEIENGN